MIGGIALPAVIGAAAADSINPCAFAVLIILMATVLKSGSRNRALAAGLVFTGVIYVIYLLMGLGLMTALAAAHVTRTFFLVVAILAILIGLFNIKDYFWYGKWFVMEVPPTWRPAMKKVLRSVTSVPGAAFAAILVSFFLLPCTSGPYIVILGLLADKATRLQAIPLLLLYNLVFILPMLVINIAVYRGLTSPSQLEEKRVKRVKLVHLITGLIMLGLGLWMLTQYF